MEQIEFEAGPNQLVVVYQPLDDGNEVDPAGIWSAIAEDAGARAANGYWIVSTSTMHARHAGTFMGRDGSGFTTKVSITIVYGRAASETATP